MKQSAATNPPDHGALRYRISVPWLIATIVLLAVSIPCIYFWHSYSLVRLSETLFKNALAHLATGEELSNRANNGKEASTKDSGAEELSQATRLLWQYVRIRPQDPTGKIRLAEAYSKSPEGLRNPNRAAELFRDAVAVTDSDERERLRLRLADMLIAGGNFAEATGIAKKLLDAPHFSDNPNSKQTQDVWRIMALSLMGQVGIGSFTAEREKSQNVGMAVGDVVQQAIAVNPTLPEVAVGLADVYRHADADRLLSETQKSELTKLAIDRPEKANRIVAEMLQRNPDSAPAFLASYIYKRSYGLSDAVIDLKRAWALDPDSPRICFLMGSSHLEQAAEIGEGGELSDAALVEQQRLEWSKAKSCFQKSIAGNKANQAAYLQLGIACYLLKDLDEAIQVWTQGLEVVGPKTLDLYPRLIGALIESLQLDRAVSRLDGFRSYIAQQSRRAGSDPRKIADANRTHLFLQGLLLLKQRAYGPAIDKLLQLIALESNQPTEKAQAYKLLGDVFSDLKSPNRAGEYYDLGLNLDPTNLDLCRSAAQRFATAGRDDKAESLYEKLVSLTDSSEDLLQFATFLFDSQMRLPPDKRNWQRFDEVLQQTKLLSQTKPVRQPLRIMALKVGAAIGKRQVSVATANSPTAAAKANISELDQLEQNSRTDPELCKQLIEFHRLLGDSQKVQALVTQFSEMSGQKPDAYLVPATVAIRNGDAERAAQTLKNGIAKMESDADRLTLELALARLGASQLKFDEALAHLERLTVELPNEPGVLLALADWTIQLDRVPKDQTNWERRLPDIEGTNGPLSESLMARRLVLAAENSNNANSKQLWLSEAERHQKKVVSSLPNWPTGYTLAGWIFDAQSQLATSDSSAAKKKAELANRALAAFQRAVQLGERQPSVLFRLSFLLNDAKKAAEILNLLDPETITGNATLAGRQTRLALAVNDLDYAKKVAQAAVDKRPGDLSSWLMLANVRLRERQFDQVDDAAQNAKTIALQSADPLIGLIDVFRFHLAAAVFSAEPAFRKRQLDQASQLASAIVELQPEPERVFTRATLLAAMNDPAAAQLYLEIEQSNPSNPIWLEQIVNYFSVQNVSGINSIDVVIRNLERLVKLDPQNADYKQRLATALEKRGTVPDLNRIAELLAPTDSAATKGKDNLRARAILMFQRRNVPTADRIANLKKSIVELDTVANSNDGTPSDHILIAQMYEEWRSLLGKDEASKAESNLQLARKYYLQAANLPALTLEQLFAIARFFVAQTDVPQAELFISKFEQALPESLLPSAGPVALRVQLLLRQNAPDKDQRISKLIEDYISRGQSVVSNLADPSRAALYVRIASLFQVTGRSDAAIEWYRKATEFDQNTVTQLAHALGQQNQKQEAVQLCGQAFEKTKKVELIYLLAEILINGNPDANAFEAADPIYQAAIKSFPNDALLMMSIGNCLARQPGKVDAAIAAYNRGLEVEPKNVFLLNNLATVLADIADRRADALALIERAIAIQGKHPALLNTKATVLMLQGQDEQALDILKQIANAESDERTWMVLAETNWQLYSKTNQESYKSEARRALDFAIAKGVEAAILTPPEVTRLTSLKQQISQSPKP